MEQAKRNGRRRAALAVALALALLGSVSACVLFGPNQQELQTIRKGLGQDDALLLDVRSPGEFADGHLAGAVNIPVGELEGRLAEVGSKDRPVVVY